MWNYVYFIAYLEDKEKTEYTGIESYIYNKIKDYDTSWFPIHRFLFIVEEYITNFFHHFQRAIALKQIEENDEELLNKKLNIIQTQVKILQKIPA